MGSIIAIFIAIGNTATGIVALGNGIGLPLWVLIGTAGAMIGLLAEKIKKQMKSPRRD